MYKKVDKDNGESFLCKMEDCVDSLARNLPDAYFLTAYEREDCLKYVERIQRILNHHHKQGTK